MYQQEFINVPAPIGTRKQVRAAAKNRGLKPEALMGQILVNGLSQMSGGIGEVEDNIPQKRVDVLEKENRRLRKAIAEVEGCLSELTGAVRNLSQMAR